MPPGDTPRSDRLGGVLSRIQTRDRAVADARHPDDPLVVEGNGAGAVPDRERVVDRIARQRDAPEPCARAADEPGGAAADRDRGRLGVDHSCDERAFELGARDRIELVHARDAAEPDRPASRRRSTTTPRSLPQGASACRSQGRSASLRRAPSRAPDTCPPADRQDDRLTEDGQRAAFGLLERDRAPEVVELGPDLQ